MAILQVLSAMAMDPRFSVVSVNASRIGLKSRIDNLRDYLLRIVPDVVLIQEIQVFTAREVFSPHFSVFINLENRAAMSDRIGMMVLVKKNIKVFDYIIGETGRILGIKINDMQVWNVYPISGSDHAKDRAVFFEENLPNLMAIWKDQTTYVIQGGDHNCTNRLIDSENHPAKHFQKEFTRFWLSKNSHNLDHISLGNLGKK